MDPISSRTLLGAAGAGAEPVYVEDVFSTWLYKGNNTTQTITNGIDLDGEGGMVWIKGRNGSSPDHMLYDTERGIYQTLSTNSTNTQISRSTTLTSFNSDGFTLGGYVYTNHDGSSGSTFPDKFASWTFRKARGFFDVVTYTGDGTSNRALSHSLGSTPGFIAIKATSTTGNWICWHRSLTTNYSILLNTADQEQGYTRISSIGASSFSVSDISSFIGSTNASGVSYVAYLFAHDEQIFGESGSESVIKCGSFTTDSSGAATVSLGWEPQWILIKRTEVSGGSWYVVDSMRGLPVGGNDAVLRAESSGSEAASFQLIDLFPTGFAIKNEAASKNYIYIAIRRGPMKTPTDATEVFNIASTSASYPDFGFPADMCFFNYYYASTAYPWVCTRLLPPSRLSMSSDAAEVSETSYSSPSMDGGNNTYGSGWSSANFVPYGFRRAPGFFDVVAYTGTGFTSSHSHNLNAVPELIIVKNRSQSSTWRVYNQTIGNTKALALNLNNAAITTTLFGNTSPTSTVFTVGGFNDTNQSGSNYVAYLFATLDGVSKVGSYTGTGSNINVDCGFSAGARFVLIKRTDSTGDWYQWDTTNGIVAGDDPYYLINDGNTGQVINTDYIDPYSLGFTITSTAPAALNASGGSYIFLAIA